MPKVVWLADPGEFRTGSEQPKDLQLRRRILLQELADRKSQALPIAHLERTLPPDGSVAAYKKARGQGVRAFTLWADAYRSQVFAYVTTKSAAKGQAAAYEVLGASGESVAMITREPAAKGGSLRTRWTVQQAGHEPAVGRKGNVFWWWVWWLMSPIQLVVIVASILGGGDVARTPRRTKWRRDGQVVLDWQNGAGNFELHVHDDHLDPRVAASLVALLRSHDSWLGHSWDDQDS
ncbi:hypothetical protein P8605_24585 [Streptomyces sp. T-3]|nr:hypothetical protein [Streptomyces sp. T-3]